MKVDPCTICGGTDLNLVDGFYYCVECGTQDVNAQETVVEQTKLADGTFALKVSRKVKTVLNKGVEMSGEWYKWHTFNFILCGLTEELVALGAKPSVKTKVLWVWALYIKQHQVKEDAWETSAFSEKDETITSINGSEDIENVEKENENVEKENEKSNKIKMYAKKDISVITKQMLLGILYVALNLDQSDLQISHLLRYSKNNQISISNCAKFIPKELNTNLIPYWINFIKSNICNAYRIQTCAMSIFKNLDIGTPIVPDLRKLIDSYIKELSLPQDFKNLVFSIMNLAPCDFLDVQYKKNVRIPDYEGVAMSYVLVALKMCFGLDDDYEVKLSNVVDKINDEECYMKSHKLGIASEPTDRLFSFREWCNYLQFRKTMLCKYYLPYAKQHNLEADDHVFMEQSTERSKRKIELSDEVTMDILDKIPHRIDTHVIPKTKFQPTLTPISTYTEVIVEYVEDPELKLLLSEDFTQYSLKYACENLKLLMQENNVVTGISETNKTINPILLGSLVSKKSDLSMVYVKNCENKNWFKTKRPTEEHIMTVAENSNESEKKTDLIENTPTEIESTTEKSVVIIADDIEIERELETICEEDIEKSIFDDLFDDIIDDKKEGIEAETKVNSFEFTNEPNYDFQDNNADINDSKSDTCNLSLASFNPVTFDRDKAIKELILEACQKYKIPIPREYNHREPRKRKQPLVHIGTGQSEAKKRKRKRLKPGEAKRALNRIFDAYYSNLEKDVLHKVSDHVNLILQNLQIDGLDELEEELHSKSSISLNDNRIGDLNGNNELNTDPTDVSAENVIVTDNNENSVLCNDSDEGDLLPKFNPKFDPKTYDSSQLYLKFKDEFNFDDILDFDDPALKKLIDRKIKEHTKDGHIELLAEGSKEINESDKLESDSDEDSLLAEISQKKDDGIQKIQNIEPLIRSPDDVHNFKYWFRHYSRASDVTKSAMMQQKFDLELEENCPRSFNFVIHECAAILDCSTYILYKCMTNIERMLIFKVSKK